MELIITEQELKSVIRKEVAPTRLDIHEIKMDLSTIKEAITNMDGRMDRLETLSEGLYMKLDKLAAEVRTISSVS